jgi:hypothetical protein
MGSSSIPIEEINFHPTSFCDRNGRVFWWRGELYRGISPERVGFYRDLFARGIAQRLIEKKLLVATELTEFTLENYPLVLKHHLLPFVSYAHEWCPAMLKDCGRLVTELMLELAEDNLTLSDVSTFDIMFDSCQPVFVDFGSLTTTSCDRTLIRYTADFRTYFIDPLTIAARGYGKLSRWLFADYDHDVMAECAALINESGKQQLKAIKALEQLNPVRAKQIRGIIDRFKKLPRQGKSSSMDTVRQLWQELEQIPLNSTSDRAKNSVSFSLEPTQKQITVEQILRELKPHTVMDLGSDTGWYSQLCASLGSRVIAIDIDEQKVTQCYRDGAANNLSVLPLVMNFRNPSPGYGICNRTVAPATKRLPCELVMAFGLIHLLVFEQLVTLTQIAETLALFAQKWLLVEFYQPQDSELSPANINDYPEYTLENFCSILQQWFATVKIIPSDRESRVLLLCQKRSNLLKDKGSRNEEVGGNR